MVAKTYFVKFSTGVTPFTGHTTNIGSACVTPVSGNPALGELSVTNMLCTASSPRHSIPSGPVVPAMRFALGAAYGAATIVTGASLRLYVRKTAVKTFYLEAYNSAGTLQATSAGTTTPSGTAMRTINLTAEAVTVPAGGFVALRIDSGSGSSRIYFGTTGKTSGISGQLNVDEVAALSADNTADVAAAMPVFGAVVSAGFTAPTTKTASANIKDSADSAVPNGLTVHVLRASDGVRVADVTTSGGTGLASYQNLAAVHPDYIFVLKRQVGFTTETITTPAVTPV